MHEIIAMKAVYILIVLHKVLTLHWKKSLELATRW